MAVPFQITGAGNQDAQYVFRVGFSENLAFAPIIEAWDNAETFPERTVSGATVVNEIFTGTTENENIPMLYAVSTTEAAPGNDWKPTEATAGSANPNRLKGDTNYVTDTTVPSSGEYIYFNLGAEIPYDATVPSTTSMAHTIQIRCRYSGTEPTVSFYGNEGTEALPSWTAITAGTHGIKYCDAGTVWSSETLKLSLPESGIIDVPELGITT